MDQNARVLAGELAWLKNIIDMRVRQLREGQYDTIEELSQTPPLYRDYQGKEDACPYHNWLAINQVSLAERIALNLALSSQLAPQILDNLLIKNLYTEQLYSELGIIFDVNSKQPQPTWQTVAYLLDQDDLQNRLQLLQFINPQARLYQQDILEWQDHRINKVYDVPLVLHQRAIQDWIYPASAPTLSDQGFPAQKIATELEWDDLVLDDAVKHQLKNIIYWLRWGSLLNEDIDLKKISRPGYRTLFYGPPGTGKTLTASLIGKLARRVVYRIDLSLIVSKWVGETEKNLARIFDQAENQNWILFFDEADALFSKRTEGGGVQERYANQEVSYLLQRIEDYDGLIILASNLKDNIDPAFIRRLQSMIYFPRPNESARLAIWRNSLPQGIPLDNKLDIASLARHYDLSGGEIVNIIREASLYALAMGQEQSKDLEISRQNLFEAVRREKLKTSLFSD